MQHQGIAPDHVSLAARIAERIGELPAIATHAWSDDAACSIASIRPSSIVCVSIAVMDDQGRLRRVDEVGAWSEELDRASLSPLRERFNVVPRLGWSLGDPSLLVRGPIARLLSTTVPSTQWATSPQGRLWNSLGATDLVIGAAAIDASNPTRAIIVEVGVGAASRPLSSADAAVLQGAIGPLSRRARLAFGAEAGEPVRRLTPREEEVLEHLALGKSVKQIASELRRSPHTVHDHVKSLHVKLHASSRGELIARALGHLKPGRERVSTLAVQSA